MATQTNPDRLARLASNSKRCTANEPALILSQDEAQFLANHMVRKGLAEAQVGEPCIRTWLPVSLFRSVRVAVTLSSWVGA